MIKGNDVCNAHSTVPGKYFSLVNVDSDNGSGESLPKDCYPGQE